MTRKATVYKSSRDKLLLELNCQSIDIDGLQADNDAMQHELVDTKKLARYWQHQANEALAQMERLKEMLEESAKVSNAENLLEFGKMQTWSCLTIQYLCLSMEHD